MQNHLIPFPAPAPDARPEKPRSSRIIVHLGQQRIVFDISCQATVLYPAPPPTVTTSVDTVARQKPRPGQRS